MLRRAPSHHATAETRIHSLPAPSHSSQTNPPPPFPRAHTHSLPASPQANQVKMAPMLHQLKSSLAEFAESDEVAVILKQMLQVGPPSPLNPYHHTARGPLGDADGPDRRRRGLHRTENALAGSACAARCGALPRRNRAERVSSWRLFAISRR